MCMVAEVTRRTTDTNQVYGCSLRVMVYRFVKYEGWNFNSGNYLFTTDTK